MLAVSAGAAAQSPSLPGTQPDEFGPPEKATVTVAIPFPDIALYLRYWVAEAEGYLADEGLKVEVITSDDPTAAAVSGSVDLGVKSHGPAILGANSGVEQEIVGGYFCRSGFQFAVQPGIESAADLAGKDIVLAGTSGDSTQAQRVLVLKEAGWDVLGAGANPVYPGPGSSTWLQFFLNGSVAMMPYFKDDLAALETYGASFPVSEMRNWAAHVYVAKKGWAEENPNTLRRFLRAVMRASEFIVAPAVGQDPINKARVLEIARANGEDTSSQEAMSGPYALGSYDICPNLYYDQAAWDTTIDVQDLDVSIAFEDATDLSALLDAQAALGLGNDAPEDIPWP